MNLVVLTGRLTKDCELKYTSNQKEVVKNTIAVRRDKDNSDFISFTAFGKTAEILNQYTSKGSMISIKGEIRTGKYEKDGETKYSQDILVNSLELLSNKKQDNTSETKEEDIEETNVKLDELEITDDDLPF